MLENITFSYFAEQVVSHPALLIAVLLTLGVILVNGWTDAPNAIATCVSTRCIDVDKENMHRLYGESDLRTVVVWRSIYACIENCMDVCEHVADIVNTVIMKNS